MLTGNDRFEGFVVDVIDEVSKLLGFKYILRMVGDSNYGSLDPDTGEWNGIIRELLEEVYKIPKIQKKFSLGIRHVLIAESGFGYC